jgi:hypothetical protein
MLLALSGSRPINPSTRSQIGGVGGEFKLQDRTCITVTILSKIRSTSYNKQLQIPQPLQHLIEGSWRLNSSSSNCTRIHPCGAQATGSNAVRTEWPPIHCAVDVAAGR